MTKVVCAARSAAWVVKELAVTEPEELVDVSVVETSEVVPVRCDEDNTPVVSLFAALIRSAAYRYVSVESPSMSVTRETTHSPFQQRHTLLLVSVLPVSAALY